jgi:hypothetical protein
MLSKEIVAAARTRVVLSNVASYALDPANADSPATAPGPPAATKAAAPCASSACPPSHIVCRPEMRLGVVSQPALAVHHHHAGSAPIQDASVKLTANWYLWYCPTRLPHKDCWSKGSGSRG